MLSSKRVLSFILALCLLAACAPAGTRAKSWQDEHPGQTITSDGFVNTETCAQFDLDVDRNAYGNIGWHFGSQYYLSTPYINKLLYIGSYSEQCGVIQYVETDWAGSCFGMAATMALNRMTKTNTVADAQKLYIEQFYDTARNYIDLTYPTNVESIRDLLNYYQVSQSIDAIGVNTISAPKGSGGFDTGRLAQVVNSFKADIDADKPCMVGIYSRYGGHAIQCVDYYEYAEGGREYILLKLYDGNSVGYGATPPRWSWVKLEKLSDDAYAPTENGGADILYHQYDGAAEPLLILRYRNVAEINKTINIHNPERKSFTPTNAFLTVKDINNAYAQYAIKPVTALAGNSFFGGASYARHYGIFTQPGPNAYGEIETLPRPSDVLDVSRPFPHMEEDELQYRAISGYAAPVTPMDVQLSLLDAGEGADFAAYDVISSSGKMDINVARTRDASGAGQYADVSGEGLRLARFQPDGTLRYLKGPDGGAATDVSLYFGTQSMSGSLDMFKLHMARLGFLKLYSGADAAAYNGSVVLHADDLSAAPGGGAAMAFTFYKGALLSDEISFSAGTAAENWVKLKAEPAGGKVNITIWTDTEPTEGNRVLLNDGTYGAPFNKPPVYTTVLHARAQNSGVFDPDAYNNQNQYSLVGAQTLHYDGGDFMFKVNGPADQYVSVSIDGVMVERGFVSVNADGSVVIAQSFMKTLKDGEHRLRVQYKNGYALTAFTKGSPALSAVPAVPATGGAAPLPFTLFIAAAALLAAVVLLGRRK